MRSVCCAVSALLLFPFFFPLNAFRKTFLFSTLVYKCSDVMIKREGEKKGIGEECVMRTGAAWKLVSCDFIKDLALRIKFC